MNTSINKTTFSLVMTVHDQEEEVRSELPRLLGQHYDDYEVIVVDEHSSDNTIDVLNLLKAGHPQLYTTFLPKYHFQQHRRRLAFTIGVKAAKKDWIIFTDISTIPPSETWLEELSEYTGSDTVLALGYVNHKSGDIRLRLFNDVSAARGIINKAEHWREGQGHRWMRYLKRATDYDYIAVRADLGHEVLRLFA